MKTRKRYCTNTDCEKHLLIHSPLNMILSFPDREYVCTKCNTLYREDTRKPGILTVKPRVNEKW